MKSCQAQAWGLHPQVCMHVHTCVSIVTLLGVTTSSNRCFQCACMQHMIFPECAVTLAAPQSVHDGLAGFRF